MKSFLLLCLLIPALLVEASYIEVHETDVVAATLILEAGGEYHKGAMEAVNEVIENRARNRNKNQGVVCLQKYQFSCWNSVDVLDTIAKAKNHPRWNEAVQIVTSKIKTNYTNGADHYHADYCNPYWVPGMSKTTKIGLHIFYKS
jgi:spore germination cell wall hydrolase CwlJ-like protein